ncbi:hypothetical protein LTR91_011152 [Friedmanniomyces endolithicus]|uniref:Uncharacterized protein n=1 Tax=Friedmanniomyces endolithicus TaxID=329885 RepID=A0AAN6KHS4_9PEZI|nr:hypothetical protein LTR94_023099 [Friedmanniomyces endolithicus]KAK0768219.1 hypothetical protein LTR59_017833 [Friedmanniomyces endolithicus]KAK0771157.1 hypothetical protein LTR75_017735 [Friedmanniomyces endolithicus]KAK0775032.1 hypothetical protein LTR38_015993 [Friedmanniomyces endolithicus]KAK0822991.1 hypothetical protein LTR03_018028 [Friedmanniomyces endolithicus]
MNQTPTFLDMPPPPSDPLTPDIPSRSGTPNSATTSMSELSTVAIKDGHRGHMPHHPHSSRDQPSGLLHQLDAERADRISRLAGLERVTTARNPTPHGNLTPGQAAPPQQAGTMSYFDAAGNPAIGRERSTVGSASATGSVGARTTWAGSEAGDADKMSESQDMDMDTSSVGGMSEEGTGSLVGFGEGARTPARQSMVNMGMGSSGKGSTPTTARDAKMMEGMMDDHGVVGATASESQMQQRNFASPSGVEQAERIVRENMDTTSNDRMREGNQQAAQLGKFGFES